MSTDMLDEAIAVLASQFLKEKDYLVYCSSTRQFSFLVRCRSWYDVDQRDIQSDDKPRLRGVCAAIGSFSRKLAGRKGTKTIWLTARQSRDLLLIFVRVDFVNALVAYELS